MKSIKEMQDEMIAKALAKNKEQRAELTRDAVRAHVIAVALLVIATILMLFFI